MAENYILKPKAKQQLNDSFDWYEEQKENLGDEFVGEVFAKIDQIAEKPLSNAILYKDIRRANLKRFPFFIYYAFRNSIVFILSIWHKKRETHPKLDDR